MARVTVDIEIPDGQHLGFSQQHDGAYSALLFSDGEKGVQGHAPIYPHWSSEDEESSPPESPSSAHGPEGGPSPQLGGQEAAVVIGALVALAALIVAVRPVVEPHIEGWWNRKLLPMLREVRRRSMRVMDGLAMRVSDRSFLPGPAKHRNRTLPRDVSDARLRRVLREFRDDPQDRRLREAAVDAIVARAFAGRHPDALEVLELEGVGDLLSAGAERDLLTPERVRLTLDQLLRRNPFLVEAESISQIGHLLGGGRPEGQLAPLRIGRLLDR